jgi:hypothetical protein
MNLTAIQADYIDEIWSDVRESIVDACSRSNGRLTADLVEDRLRRKEMQLWLAVNGSIRGVCITEVVTHDTGLKVCSIVIGTGDGHQEWSHLIDGIEKWAKAIGCKRIDSRLRPGWVKPFKEFGWRETHRFMEKGL